MLGLAFLDENGARIEHPPQVDAALAARVRGELLPLPQGYSWEVPDCESLPSSLHPFRMASIESEMVAEKRSVCLWVLAGSAEKIVASWPSKLEFPPPSSNRSASSRTRYFIC